MVSPPKCAVLQPFPQNDAENGGLRLCARHITRVCKRPLSASSIVTTRNPDNPRIHVQSRRDPTGPPLLVAHQERTTSNPGWHVGSRVDIQAAEQTAHPNCGPRRRPSIT